jgi:hypothetical protein
MKKPSESQYLMIKQQNRHFKINLKDLKKIYRLTYQRRP